jgi:cytidylate kinase
MYRAAAFHAEQQGVSLEDHDALEKVCREMTLAFHGDHEDVRILLDGKDVSDYIRSPGIGEKASRISRFSGVRRILVQRQREMGKKGAIVMEGRDIGSVVFPDADVKIFLDASEEERAKRRYREWIGKGFVVEKERALKDIRTRDARDTTRDVSPLQIPKGAARIDTTHLTLEEVVEWIMRIIEKRLEAQVRNTEDKHLY